MTEHRTVTVPAPAAPEAPAQENTEHGFMASSRLRESLQRVLVDLIDLHLVAKQAHWNVVGTNFRDLHLNLDELVDLAREQADVMAERLRALHATADGRAAVVAAHTTLPSFPAGEVGTRRAIEAVVACVDSTVATLRAVHDGVDEDDPTSADLLHEAIAKLEQQSWFLGAELRVPASEEP